MSDTKPAVYKTVPCHKCGSPMLAGKVSRTWATRIDNKMHDIWIPSVPCIWCPSCDICLLDDSSDDFFKYAHVKYCKENGLYTPWHRARRWLRRRFLRWYDWVMRIVWPRR